MTLRARLTLFFAGIVVVPLIAATLVLQHLVAEEVERRSASRLDIAAEATTALWDQRVEQAQREVTRAAQAAAASGGTRLDQIIEQTRVSSGLDFLVVTNVSGGIEAASLAPAEYLPSEHPPTAFDIVGDESTPLVLRSRAELSGARLGQVSGGWYLDRGLLRDLLPGSDVSLALIVDDRAVASTATPVPPVPDVVGQHASIGEDLLALVTSIRGQDGRLMLLVPTEAGPAFQISFWAIAALGVLLASMLGYLLAGVIARPVKRLTEASRAVSEGNLDTRIEVRDRGDIGELAEAFNLMTENLRSYIAQLEGSRDELRRGLERLGTTLQSTLDLDGMLGVVLETASATLGATSGAVFLLAPSGRELRLQAARGFEPPPLASLRSGEGIAGIAAQGRPVLVPTEMEEPPQRAPVEPAADTAIAVPLRRGDRTIGVLALYGREVPEPFGERDASTLASLAGQASIGIENVLLHEEARRLSITDGLTGVWNRRYLEMVLRKEVERAQRFGRPLSVMMIDLDRFKEVNDRYGHLAGDEILVEVVSRITESVRGHIDIVARYGGEEFVAVLPETPADGAWIVAEKIRSVVSEATVDAGRRALQVTVSVGVAAFPEAGVTADGLLARADEAMYRAKQAGRNRVEMASGTSASAASRPRSTL